MIFLGASSGPTSNPKQGVRFIFFGLLNGWPVLMGPCAAAAAGDTRQTEVPCVSFSWDQAGGKWMKQIFKLQIDMGWLEILFLLKRMFVACFFA